MELLTRASIHCLLIIGEELIPCAFGFSIHETTPNDLLQLDYLELTEYNTGNKYVLMLMDYDSGYIWFYPRPSPNAEQAAHSINDWCAAFFPSFEMVFSSLTHFHNETLRRVSKAPKSSHYFT